VVVIPPESQHTGSKAPSISGPVVDKGRSQAAGEDWCFVLPRVLLRWWLTGV